jgi:hypothetical protein
MCSFGVLEARPCRFPTPSGDPKVNSQRVYELADELDVNKHELVATINELDLGIAGGQSA